MGDLYVASLLRPYLGDVNAHEVQRECKEREERIKNAIGPFESLVMRGQSILTWEKPEQSAVVFLGINAGFWLLSYSGFKILFVLATTTVCIIIADLWRSQVWPEIHVLPSARQFDEGWTPMHARLLSLPELAHHAAEWWTCVRQHVRAVCNMRRLRPAAFCLLASATCLTLAAVGHVLSGATIIYIAFMSALLWPCVVYHKLMPKVYTYFEPILMKLEYTMKTKNARVHRGERSATCNQGKVRAETDSDSDVENSPLHDPFATAALARIITDSEEEEDSAPYLARGAAREANWPLRTDVSTEDDLCGFKKSSAPSVAKGDQERALGESLSILDVAEMPAHDDNYDDDTALHLLSASATMPSFSATSPAIDSCRYARDDFSLVTDAAPADSPCQAKCPLPATVCSTTADDSEPVRAGFNVSNTIGALAAALNSVNWPRPSSLWPATSHEPMAAAGGGLSSDSAVEWPAVPLCDSIEESDFELLSDEDFATADAKAADGTQQAR